MDATLHDRVVDALLTTTSVLLGLETAFVGLFEADRFTFGRVQPGWNGVAEGVTVGYDDTLCARMVAGGPRSTADAGHDPTYAEVATRAPWGIVSYAAVPLRSRRGDVFGTLGGLDRSSVPVADASLRVLHRLGEVLTCHLDESLGPAIRRVPRGWQVAGETADDLNAAMVLADLLSADLPAPARPVRPEGPLDEVGRLRLAVTQLEHALGARIVVEQAIGVLSERLHTEPREAFERLRKVARSRGRRVHDLAREVVVSASAPQPLALPRELTGSR